MLLGILIPLIIGYLYNVFTSDSYWLLKDFRSLILLIIIYPLIEEITFRGWMQEYISKTSIGKEKFFNISIANIFTTILFTLMHLIHHSYFWAFLVIFPSLIFGYFKEQFNSVIPPIILHSFYNFMFFSIIYISE